METSSFEEMRKLSAQFPFMTDLDDFVLLLEEDLQPQIVDEKLADFRQRVSWLKQIAQEEG